MLGDILGVDTIASQFIFNIPPEVSPEGVTIKKGHMIAIWAFF